MVREVIQGPIFTRSDQKPEKTCSSLDVPTPAAGGTDNRPSPIACGRVQLPQYASKLQTHSAAIGGSGLSARDLSASATRDVEQGKQTGKHTSTVGTRVTGFGGEIEPPHTSGTVASAQAMMASNCTANRPTRTSSNEGVTPLDGTLGQKHGENVNNRTTPSGSLAPSPCQVMPWDEELGCDRGVPIVGKENMKEGRIERGVIPGRAKRISSSERSISCGGMGGGGAGEGDGEGEGKGGPNGPAATTSEYPVRPLSAQPARRRTEVKVDGPATSSLGNDEMLSVRANSTASRDGGVPGYGGDTSLKGGGLTGASMGTLQAYMKGPGGKLDIFAAARDGQVRSAVLNVLILV